MLGDVAPAVVDLGPSLQTDGPAVDLDTLVTSP
jgi:hypothetical protein